MGWIVANPLTTVAVILSYALVGLVYSLLKWRFSFLAKKSERYRELVSEFRTKVAESQPDTPADAPVDSLELFYPGSNNRRNLKEFLQLRNWDWSSVRASRNKTRIVVWVAYWPWSLVWTLIDDPFRWLAEKVYHTFRGWYVSLTKNAFKGMEGVSSELD